MRHLKRQSRALVVVAVFACALTACAETPSKSDGSGLSCGTVDWILSYSPGGGSDQSARRLIPSIEKSLDVNVNLIYRTGGAGAAGWQSIANSEADGCTVGTAVYPDMALQATSKDAGYRMQDSFTYLAWHEEAPNALFVGKNSEFADLDELITAAESNPEGLSFGGSGDSAKLVMQQIEDSAGIQLSYVPFEDGVGKIVPALLGGHIDMGVGGATHVAGQYKDSVQALAVAGSRKVPALDGTPTFKQLGYDGVTVATVWGVIGPKGIDDKTAELWNDAINRATKQVTSKIEALGETPLHFDTPEDATNHILDELKQLPELNSN